MRRASFISATLTVCLIAILAVFGFLVIRDARNAAEQKKAPAPTVRATDPQLGPPDAKVTIIEFGDFSCDACRSAQPALSAALAQVAGSVRLVWKDFPLDSIHPYARVRAVAARCAADQGKFWEMHDLLFSNSQATSTEQLTDLATSLALGQSTFRACLTLPATEKLVADALFEGQKAGVDGTPFFFLNGKPIAYTPSQQEWVALIDDNTVTKKKNQ